ncbi:flavin reductase family protein [Georgenia ruanii]|uniref:flavin reductase family protein n=1 Tax=Georgenia ruanii TaxID=348442 RepID=UPI001D025D5A|nr:flavin reductase family protein [Georgenia ruanii]
MSAASESYALDLPGVAPAEISAERFKTVFRNHPAGVAVITLRGPDGPVGFTATSVFSISAEPPLLGFSVAGTSSSLPAVRAASSLAVNFLAADQAHLATQFARKNVDRFAGVDWLPLPSGEPVLRGGAAWVRGHIEQRTPAGESLLVVVRAVLADHDAGQDPLVYVDHAYHQLGEHSRLL